MHKEEEKAWPGQKDWAGEESHQTLIREFRPVLGEARSRYAAHLPPGGTSPLRLHGISVPLSPMVPAIGGRLCPL